MEKMNFYEMLGLKIGGGVVGGAICGFLIKQFVKFLAFLLVVYFGSLAYLAHRDYIAVRWQKLLGDLTSMNLQPYITGLLDLLVSFGVISASFIGGFYLGFKKG